MLRGWEHLPAMRKHVAALTPLTCAAVGNGTVRSTDDAFTAHPDYWDNSSLQLPEKLTFCSYLLGIMSCLSSDTRTQGESRQSPTAATARTQQLDIQQADSSCGMAACSTICWLTPPLLWGFILLDTGRNVKLLPNRRRESYGEISALTRCFYCTVGWNCLIIRP